jgi:DNA polymerase III sliding clamp (beta) subunit (PCNA family)
MKIPAFIRSIIGCTDNESSRYALGAVKFENESGVSHAIATDGRQLVEVSWPERLDKEVDVLLVGDSLKKAASAAIKRGKPTAFEVLTEGQAIVNGGGGSGLATVLSEGRFPRWRDVFSDKDDDKCFKINLCPDLLSTLMAVYQQAGCETVRLWLDDPQSGVRMAATAPSGETIRCVLMPKEDSGVTQFPGCADPEPRAEAVAVAAAG